MSRLKKIYNINGVDLIKVKASGPAPCTGCFFYDHIKIYCKKKTETPSCLSRPVFGKIVDFKFIEA